MSAIIQANVFSKVQLRSYIKEVLAKNMNPEGMKLQSDIINRKVIRSGAFREAQRISVYLSTSNEVSTTLLLSTMFHLKKDIFVPTYNRKVMEMVRLNDMEDYEKLPVTKWNIKQPKISDNREDALANGGGIDLFLVPGVAFTSCGKRLGHGKGYYDEYLTRHRTMYPHKKVCLMGLAFKEQLIPENVLPVESHDVRLDMIISSTSSESEDL